MEKDLILERDYKYWTEEEILNALKNAQNFTELYRILFNRKTGKNISINPKQKESIIERISNIVNDTHSLHLINVYEDARKKYLKPDKIYKKNKATKPLALNINSEKEKPEEKLLFTLKAVKNKKGTKSNISEFEKDLVTVLRKKLPEIIPGFNSAIKYGEENTEKEKANIKSISNKFNLDYDICFELPRNINGYNKVAINLDGPTHNAAITYWENRQNDYLRLPIVKGDPKTLFLRKEISYSKNDNPNSKESKVYKYIVGKILHEIRAALYDDDSEEIRAENKLKEKFQYEKATEEEKKKISDLIYKEKERVRSGMDRERERAQNYAVEKALLDIKQALENAEAHGQNTKYKVKDKYGYNTGQIKDLKDFVNTEQGQKSLKKNLMAWSEVAKPDIDIQHWIAKHQAGQGQINYDSKNYPVDNKKFVKLFEEIKRRTSK